jgi:hypothetical protein
MRLPEGWRLEARLYKSGPPSNKNQVTPPQAHQILEAAWRPIRVHAPSPTTLIPSRVAPAAHEHFLLHVLRGGATSLMRRSTCERCPAASRISRCRTRTHGPPVTCPAFAVRYNRVRVRCRALLALVALPLVLLDAPCLRSGPSSRVPIGLRATRRFRKRPIPDHVTPQKTAVEVAAQFRA